MFSFPVSAYNSGDVLFTSYNGVNVLNFEDTDFTQGYNSNDFVSTLSSAVGFNLDDYYYYLLVGVYMDRFTADIGIFEKNDLIDDTLSIGNSGYLFEDSYTKVKYSAQSSFFVENNQLSFRISNSSLSFRTVYDYNGTMGLITNIPKVSYDGSIVKSDIFVNYDMIQAYL